MRVTIDLPDDLYEIVAALSRDKAQTLSETVVELIPAALENRAGPGAGASGG